MTLTSTQALAQTIGLLLLRSFGIPVALILSIYYLHIWTYLVIVLVILGLVLVVNRDQERRWNAQYGKP